MNKSIAYIYRDILKHHRKAVLISDPKEGLIVGTYVTKHAPDIKTYRMYSYYTTIAASIYAANRFYPLGASDEQ